MIEVIIRKEIESKQHEQIIDLTSLPTDIENNWLSKGPSSQRRNLVFVTGNSDKYTELKNYFPDENSKGLSIIQRDIDLPEIQHENLLKIVEEKCRSAYHTINSIQSAASDENKYSILIEDTSMGFDDWKGLPGPYIKWFLKQLGPGGLHQMLTGFSNKSATAICTYAIMDNPNEITFCRGSIAGEIVAPRGDKGFGWDSCFQENKTRLTFGEMEKDTKRKFSHRSNAVLALKHYLLGLT